MTSPLLTTLASHLRSYRDTTLMMALLLVWVVAETVLYLYHGTQLSVDSPVYIDNAHRILSGRWPEGRDVWYTSYSLFLALVFWCGGALTAVVVVQILLSGVAACMLYGVCKVMVASRWTAVLTVLLYVGWFKIHEWDTFVYTESLFTSCSIIAFALLVRSSTVTQYGAAIVLIVFAFFIRPTGFCFVVGLACYGMYRWRNALSAPAWIAGGVVLAVLGMLLLNNMLRHFTLLDSYSRGEIIYPNISLGTTPPQDLYVPAEGSPLWQLATFVVHNPLYFLKLCTLKFLLFVGNIKPYFSTLHNVLIAVVLYPLYFFAVIGFRRFPPRRGEKYFIVGYCLAQCATVSLTTENWDGRFLVPLLPFVFLLSAVGIVWAVKRYVMLRGVER